MVIKNLKLLNFRNFAQADLNFSQTTLLVGDNAQGKSNLLESIYFLATTKSPRADKDLQLIKENEQVCRVEGEVGEDTNLEIAMQKRDGDGLGIEKRVKVNGVPRRVSDYIGNLVAVHFSPEDINLVCGPPSLRRWHLDLTLAQVDKDYKAALNTYHVALSSRNKILKGIKEGTARIDELDFWTEQMIGAGEVLEVKRQEFFQFINEKVASAFLDDFRFLYHPSQISRDRNREYLTREVAAGMSLIGPHRDDFTFKGQGKDLAYFGSRGEQRTAVLKLKLAELKFISDTKKTLPVLLLDDVFSELDKVHRDFVVLTISGQQTILSTVEMTQIPAKFLKNLKLVKVENGGIKT